MRYARLVDPSVYIFYKVLDKNKMFKYHLLHRNLILYLSACLLAKGVWKGKVFYVLAETLYNFCIYKPYNMGKERIMSKMLRTHQNTIGNLAIALLFVGGCIFLLTGSWDTSESVAAKGCCGGDTTATSCCGGATTLVAETTTVSESSGNVDCACANNVKCNLCGTTECDGPEVKICKPSCNGDGGDCGPDDGIKCNEEISFCNNVVGDGRYHCNGTGSGCTN